MTFRSRSAYGQDEEDDRLRNRKNHEKGNAMTTCALGCSKNGLLRFFLIMTDSALNDKENFIVRCRVLSALRKKRRIETYA